MEFEIGSVIEGTVKSITNFGAFIALPGGKTGMVHISEVANTYVSDIHDFLQEGQTTKVKVLSVDPAGKIGLSIKKAIPPAPRPPRQNPNQRPPVNSNQRPSAPRASAPRPAAPEPQDFESKLKRFMADSDSKLAASRQYSERRPRSRRK